MATVTNLQIKLQEGSDNTLYATWEFKESPPPAGGGGSSGGGGGGGGTVRPGAVVTVNRGAVWYNGVGIAPFVFDRQWIVLEVRGDRVVLNKDTGGVFAIMSAISSRYLTVVRSRAAAAPLAAQPRATELSNLDHYEVQWYYATGGGVWFDGGSSSVKLTNHTYNYPNNASKVKVVVKPVSKTYQSNGKETSYWTGVAASKEYLISELPPERLSAPTVTLDKYTLTAKIENIEDAKCEDVEFEVYKGDTKFATGKTTVKTARAAYTCQIAAGGKYRVRCRGVNYVGGSPVYGEWSPYSSEVTAVPGIPQDVTVTVESETSVKVSWKADSTATSYTVEYAAKRSYFDASSEVKSTTVETNYAILTGLETGHEWYFRVSATNSQGESGWSEIVYKIVGTKPEPPTTWSLTTTAIVGEPVILYWVHNSEDGSKQYEAQIELTVNGEAEIKTIDTSGEEVDEDEINKVYSYELDMSPYPDGAEILWRVRTRGITFEYSDWSVQRTINVYAPPVSTLTLGDGSGTMASYPFTVAVTAGPDSQTALSYHVSVTSEFSYRTEDYTGQTVIVNAGDEVYSRIFTISDNNFSVDLMPEDLVLENTQVYKVTVTVAMNSGLTTVAEGLFTVSWNEENYMPDAQVAFDKDNLYAYIKPYCMNPETDELFEDVVLAVYRREYDGTFTEIAINIENYGDISVTDPHPSLDFARYRIVARSLNTNVIGFTDLPALPVSEPSIVIQWDEAWSEFDYNEESSPEIPFYVGSMLKLPYNVDVSESYEPDRTTVEYIGRKHPVGYYGTQKGVTATWKTEIPAYDKETLYGLRRLANWNGNVYVREPSGSGYTAQVKVSMSQTHLNLTIPITINVTRVEDDE